jgi:hypothetical protein
MEAEKVSGPAMEHDWSMHLPAESSTCPGSLKEDGSSPPASPTFPFGLVAKQQQQQTEDVFIQVPAGHFQQETAVRKGTYLGNLFCIFYFKIS